MGSKKRHLYLYCASLAIILGGASYYWTHHTDSFSFLPTPSNCSNQESAHASLAKSSDPVLRKLSEYEQVCHGAVVDSLMFFIPMPTTNGEASQFASQTAKTLKDFSNQHIKPLVVFEPSLTSPTVIKDFKRGIYDTILKTYYQLLKTKGITDVQMGTWVLFPEANTPSWQTTEPDDFTANITKLAVMQKDAFPSSKISILLNSQTYQDNDTQWSNGKLVSLLPYISNIPKGLIDSFGYQGFPDAPPANTPNNDASQLSIQNFLPAGLASNAATQLGVSVIWLNTGTFKRTHTDSPATRSSTERSATANYAQ